MNQSDQDIEKLIDAKHDCDEDGCEYDDGACEHCGEPYKPLDFSGATPGDR